MPCNEASLDKRNTAVRYREGRWSVVVGHSPRERDILPSETSHERNEFVEVLCASPAEYSAAHDNDEPERVLLPLDVPIHLPTSCEEAILHDPHGREELQWHGKQNRERIEELHRLSEA
jgi:hypothetical protein